MEQIPRVDVAGVDDRDTIKSLILDQFLEHAIEVNEQNLINAIEAVLSTENLGFFLLARQRQEVVGVAYVSFTWTLEHCGKSAWLEELYVTPEHRNLGTGRDLLAAVVDQARRRGCAAVDLEVTRSQNRAEGLYERGGFRRMPRSRWVLAISKGRE